MGQYLSSPVTEKDTLEGSSEHLDYGIAAHQGWRKNMEDAHIAHQLSHGTYLFGVFDGHGGPEVAKFCALHLRGELERSAAFREGLYADALVGVFHRMDEMMRSQEGLAELAAIRRQLEEEAAPEAEGERDSYSMLRKLVAMRRMQQAGEGGAGAGANGYPAEPPEASVQAGCTAVVALVVGRRLFVANAGDSRAVLCRGGGALAMSHDHKPAAPPERARIVAAGGFVSEVGGITRVNGNLNLSRAIGDLRYKMNSDLEPKDQIITAEPDVTQQTLGGGDRFLVLACDGIWDVMDNDTVVRFVAQRLDAGMTPTQAAAELLNACVATDPRETRGVGCDNMTASVVVFRHDGLARLST